MKLNYYNEIISFENIKEAYYEIIRQFEEKSKIYTYNGIDGKNIGQFDLFSERLLFEIQKELKELKPIDSALKLQIPKRNKPGTRSVYVHTIKERIKAQAVYRVIEPVFDAYFSRFLYSYRSSHPHYKALKTVARRFNKDTQSHMIVGDISNYSDIINKNILKDKIKKIGFDDQTEKIIFLYIDVFYIKDGLDTEHEGIITGLPVMILFNNLYLDDFDKKIGNTVNLYRRIGDDFIMFDTKEKIESIKENISKILEEEGVKNEYQKIKYQKITDSFDFLGYRFENNTISILPQSIKNIQIYIRSKLRFDPYSSIKLKKKRLKNILFKGECIKFYFIQLVRQYNYANNMKQIQHISDYFFKRLTIYFFGSYSFRNQRKTIEITKDIRIISFMRYYVLFHTGKVLGKDLKNIK